MNIRLATTQDAKAISELLIVLAEQYIVTMFTDEGRRNMLSSITPNAIEGFMCKGYRYHVGEIDNRIIAVVGTRDDSHLFHLFVNEQHHGNGYSSQLWSVAKTACVDSGKNPGFFTVNASLNAQDVYKHWGFIPIGGIREGGGVKDLPMRMENAS